MPPAARVGDTILTGHPGPSLTATIATSPNAKVQIQFVPAAVAGSIISPHTGPVIIQGVWQLHPSTPILGGSSKVTFGGLPALRIGDAADGAGVIMAGSPKVLIG